MASLWGIAQQNLVLTSRGSWEKLLHPPLPLKLNQIHGGDALQLVPVDTLLLVLPRLITPSSPGIGASAGICYVLYQLSSGWRALKLLKPAMLVSN